MKGTQRTRIVAAAVAALALGPAAGAHADVERFTDPRDDTPTSVDIWRVKVDNSTRARNKVIVAVRQDNVRIGDSITIYFDTRRRDRGPEYSISAYVDSEYFMHRREGWARVGRPVPFSCGYSLKIRHDDRSRAVVPRRCLGHPSKVRVAVKVTRGIPVTSRDWARAPRTWLGWVAR